MEFISFTDTADTLFLLIGNDVYKRYLWIYFLIGAICFAIVYAFKAAALFIIARREGYNHRWMAFVPFLNTYYTGVVSSKNKILSLKPATVAIVAAAIEFVYVAMYIVYCVAQLLIFEGGYATPDINYMAVGNEVREIFTGSYVLGELPHSLDWAGWVFTYFNSAFLYWLSLLNLVLTIFLMIAFFQTYACRRYVLFALLASIFSISGILMFAVRNNAGKNYGQYLKEKQYRQYQMYQEYMRQNGGFNNNNYGSNPYNGGSLYGSPSDPFDGMGGSNGNRSGNNQSGGEGGSSSNNGSGDPFEDF